MNKKLLIFVLFAFGIALALSNHAAATWPTPNIQHSSAATANGGQPAVATATAPSEPAKATMWTAATGAKEQAKVPENGGLPEEIQATAKPVTYSWYNLPTGLVAAPSNNIYAGQGNIYADWYLPSSWELNTPPSPVKPVKVAPLPAPALTPFKPTAIPPDQQRLIF
jgi:hypothetical protein